MENALIKNRYKPMWNAANEKVRNSIIDELVNKNNHKLMHRRRNYLHLFQCERKK